MSSGTAALHAAMYALGVGPGDEVIVPAMTFAATANCVTYLGGTPVFADVDPDTLLIDPAEVEAKISGQTKAIVAVDYAGQPCDYDRLLAIAGRHGLALVDDACHAIGGSYQGRPVGSLAVLNAFSFHPVKHVTTGEGGAVATDDPALAGGMRMFRNHGITTDFRQRETAGSWAYDMVDLGYNYRLSDIQCALGITQLAKLPPSVARRQAIAAQYDAAFAELPGVQPLAVRRDCSHAYHLYVVRLELEGLSADRGQVFRALAGRRDRRERPLPAGPLAPLLPGTFRHEAGRLSRGRGGLRADALAADVSRHDRRRRRGRDRGGGESPGRLSVGVPPLGGFSDDPGWSPAFRRLFGRSG